jgi:CheY-like chemotaxis protein
MAAVSKRPHVGNKAKKISTVLVVEDEVLVRFMLAEDLRFAGYRVIEAVNADEALQILRHHTDVSLVISDIRMPGSMDGLALAKKVLTEYPELRFIFATAHVPTIDTVDHHGCFLKPYDTRTIIRHVKTLLD